MKKLIIITITSILISLVSQANKGKNYDKNRPSTPIGFGYNDAQLAVIDQYRSEVRVLNTQHIQEVNAIKDALRAEGLNYEALVGTPETRALVAAHKEKLKVLKAQAVEEITLLE